MREVFNNTTNFGHGQQSRDADAYINTIVTVSRCDRICDNTETHHLGTVEFGPITERTHLEALYDEYFEERARTGMFGLHLEDHEWRVRYDDCVLNMSTIDQLMC